MVTGTAQKPFQSLDDACDLLLKLIRQNTLTPEEKAAIGEICGFIARCRQAVRAVELLVAASKMPPKEESDE